MPANQSFMGGYDLVRRGIESPEFSPAFVREAIGAANCGFQCDLGRVAASEYNSFIHDQCLALEQQTEAAQRSREFIEEVEYMEICWEHLDKVVREYLPEAYEEAGLDLS